MISEYFRVAGAHEAGLMPETKIGSISCEVCTCAYVGLIHSKPYRHYTNKKLSNIINSRTVRNMKIRARNFEARNERIETGVPQLEA